MRRPKVPFRTRALKESKEEWDQLRLEYLEARDPLEYDFVQRSNIVESWKHWNFILASPYCRPDVDRWREELEIKLRAEALQEIIKNSKTEKGFAAQKFLLEKGWDPKRGRPSKEEVEGEKVKRAAVISEVDELFERASAASSAKLN